MNGKLIEKMAQFGDESPFLYRGEVHIKCVTDADSVLAELQLLMEIKEPMRLI